MPTKKKTTNGARNGMRNGMRKNGNGARQEDAIALLEKDHAEAREALETLKESTERAVEKRRTTLAKVALALWTHMSLEETIFYPAFAQAAETSDDEVRGMEARAEHDAAKTALMRLEACDPASTEFRAMAKVLYDLVDHHATEEEDEMFPRVRKLLGKEQLVELGSEMKVRKQELMMTRSTPARPSDEPRDLDLHAAAAE